MTDNRRPPGLPLEVDILLTIPGVGELSLKSRDLSDHGVFVVTDGLLELPLGTLVTLQVRDLVQAPRVPAQVVSCDSEGLALDFVVDTPPAD